MKKNLKEIIILSIQLLMFYTFPLVMYLIHPITTVMLMLIVTLILSIVLGNISETKLKYLYPIIIAILFLPTIFIYYNESALVHSIWYLVTSIIGLFIGVITKKLNKIIKEDMKKIIKIILIIIIALSIIPIYSLYKKEFSIGKETDIEIIGNGVSLGLKENTLTSKGAVFIIKNDTNNNVIYGPSYKLETKKDNTWHQINIEASFIEIVYELKINESKELKINWGEIYGKLNPGEYRIIKDVFIEKQDDTSKKITISEEFTIK